MGGDDQCISGTHVQEQVGPSFTDFLKLGNIQLAFAQFIRGNHHLIFQDKGFLKTKSARIIFFNVRAIMLSEPPAKIPAIPKEHHKKNTREVKGHPRVIEIKHPHPQRTHRQ